MREISFSSSTADPFRTPQLLKLSRPSPWAKAAGPSSMLCRNGRATYVTMAEESKMKAVRKRIFALYQRKKEAETERRKRPQEISLPTPTTPKTLSTVMGLSTVDVLKALIKCGHAPRSVDEVLPLELVEIACEELNFILRRNIQTQGSVAREKDESKLVRRPPIVTVMGHVNHGKTSLLDALRETTVALVEEGRITQRLSATIVTFRSGQKITFMDTPGHNAFAGMRKRGTALTDIVVLVIAADEGIMQQTTEAINHTRAAKVPLIVAINKMDKEGADPMKVKRQLLQHGIVTEEFGGDVQCVEISVSQQINLDTLVDAINAQAELLDLRIDPTGPAESVIVESRIDRTRGILATTLVRAGTLKLNNYFVAGTTWGRVRGLTDSIGRRVLEAEPSCPVEVLGFKSKLMPNPGDDLVVVSSEDQAKEVLRFRKERAHMQQQNLKFETSSSETKSVSFKSLSVLIKADVGGTLDAVKTALMSLPNDEVKLHIVRAGVGGISSSDIGLAKDTDAIVLGFNVPPPNNVLELARVEKVEVNNYSIIYHLTDAVRHHIERQLEPRRIEDELGRADVLQVFSISLPNKQKRNVAGLRVVKGFIDMRMRVRLMRPKKDDQSEYVSLYEGTIESLKKFKDPVASVKKGDQCGLGLPKFDDIQPGDVIVCYSERFVPRKLGEPKS